MRLRSTLFALLAALGFVGTADAYFVISFRDGGELRADFVREAGDKLYAFRESGEVEIDRARVRDIREIDPGVKVPSPVPPASAAKSAEPASEPVASVVPATTDELRDREKKVVRKIILGRRDLLFARLRGESAADLDQRRHELEKLEGERTGIREQIPAWEREASR